MRKSDALARANRLLDVLDAADFGEEEDSYSRELKAEVESHEKRHEAELLAAAKRISERNRKP